MNMHGIITPKSAVPITTKGARLRDILMWLKQRRIFLLVVVAPAVLLGLYLYLITSDQYVSEAHFLVRTAKGADTAPSGGLSQAIGMVTGGNNSHSDAISVADYMTSHDVVETLRREDGLVEKFHDRPADPFSKLRDANPTPEALLKYFRKHVDIHFESETGIVELSVRTFTPGDSYELARKLLELGEKRVNLLNSRSYADAVSAAQRQVEETERKLEIVQSQLTTFRQSNGDIDPEASGKSQISLVSTLTGQLAIAQAQLNSMGQMIGRTSPQYLAMAGRVRALQAQVGSQSGRLAGGHDTIANKMSGYEELQLRQQFLSKQYEAAAAALEKSREEARNQQLYITRIVDANKPVKSLYPERFRILATAIVGLMLAYSIGWLIAAGVREHAA